MRRQSNSGTRCSAQLLFQYRVAFRGRSNRMRLCEERIITFRARTAELAYGIATAKGHAAQNPNANGLGGTVYFELVGVKELLDIEVVGEADEVWYDIRRILNPMARARKLIPPMAKLNVLYWAELQKRSLTTRADREASNAKF